MDSTISIPLPQNFPLPQLHAHLSQFIHPRSEAQHIRQAVSAYISDLAESIEHGGVDLHAPSSPPSPVKLVSTEGNRDVEKDRQAFEKEIDGLLGRGSYLGPEPGGKAGSTGGEKRKTGIPKWGGGSLGKSSGLGVKPGSTGPGAVGPTEGRLGGERLRREYLLALRENILAKREYEAMAAGIGGFDTEGGDSEEEDNDQDDFEGRWDEDGEGYGLRSRSKDGGREFLDLYLSTHLLGRQLAKLNVLKQYVKEFPARDTFTAVSNLPMPNPPPPPSPSVVIPTGKASVGGTGTASTLEDAQTKILVPLEKAIFRVYNELNEEKEKLENVKKLVSQGKVGEVETGRKRVALEKTRDELIGWIEERLAHGSAETEGGEGRVGTGAGGADQEGRKEQINVHEKVVTDIEASYNDYLKSRAVLVSLIQQSIALSSTSTSTSALSSSSARTIPTSTAPPTKFQLPPMQTLPLLPLLTTHLPQQVRAQKSLLLTRTYISTTISSQKDELYRMLSLLAQDSHLLGPYLQSGAIDLDGRTPIDIARYWEEIGKARKKAVEDDVGGKMNMAKEKLKGVEEAMKEMGGLLQFDGEEESAVEAEVSGGREKRAAIPVRARKGKGGRDNAEEREKKGLWVGLGGGVGVIGDGI